MSPVTYSPSVTIPLTHDCPWRCHYCGFRSDNQGLVRDEEIERILQIAQENSASEVLLISGEMPSSMPHIRQELEQRGFGNFIDFAVSIANRCLDLGLLPHSNLGALSERQMAQLKEVTASQGLMLEGLDDDLNSRVAPEKRPSGRLKTLIAAGKASVPFTSGILIGLGETHASRKRSLELLAEVHQRFGHLQEIIIQNFVPNLGSVLAPTQSVLLAEYLDLIQFWRKIAPEVAIQIPPNLNPHWNDLVPFIDDLGGVSVERDVVNPTSPWDTVNRYREIVERQGRKLATRLPIYDRFLRHPSRWLSERMVLAIEARRTAVETVTV